jgi:hypothetical protein
MLVGLKSLSSLKIIASFRPCCSVLLVTQEPAKIARHFNAGKGWKKRQVPEGRSRPSPVVPAGLAPIATANPQLKLRAIIGMSRWDLPCRRRQIRSAGVLALWSNGQHSTGRACGFGRHLVARIQPNDAPRSETLRELAAGNSCATKCRPALVVIIKNTSPREL